MRKGLLCTFAVAVLAAGPVLAGNIDSDLQNKLDSAADGAKLSVLVYMADQVDLVAMDAALDSAKASLHDRGVTVVKALVGTAASQSDLADYLAALQANGRIDSFEAFWIINGFRVDASANEIRDLANFPGVGTIYFNYPIELIEPVTPIEDAVFDEGGADAPEWGVTMVRAPQCWAEGYDGKGVLVSNMDTGVYGDPNVGHVALKDRWAGKMDPRYQGHPEWAWFDTIDNPRPLPYDNNGHGTHTMGTICGGAPGDQVGVAPGALWIAAAPIDRVSIQRTAADAIRSFQWFANPDKNPDTTWDIPDTNSNSWGLTTGHGYLPCDTLFWQYIDACEAVGTVVIFSAGNESTSGLRRPADRARFGNEKSDYDSCAVASNNSTEGISSFSSRGPTTCTPDGSQFIKPNICAPGENVRSCGRSSPTSYTNLSGTSMASPHINGVAAIIRQACPDMPPDKVKDIMYRTARDKGTVGKDNSFGWGIVDAYAALQLALTECKPIKLGDMNCDGTVDFADIEPFVLALQSKEQYEALFPDCNYLNADCNSDGKVDFGDINPFVDLIGA